MLIEKVKYNDKILHQSKILKYLIEGENKKGSKDIDKIFKKINKNKNTFLAKDLALADTLITDGFKLPTNFRYTNFQRNLIFLKTCYN